MKGYNITYRPDPLQATVTSKNYYFSNPTEAIQTWSNEFPNMEFVSMSVVDVPNHIKYAEKEDSSKEAA